MTINALTDCAITCLTGKKLIDADENRITHLVGAGVLGQLFRGAWFVHGNHKKWKIKKATAQDSVVSLFADDDNDNVCDTIVVPSQRPRSSWGACRTEGMSSFLANEWYKECGCELHKKAEQIGSKKLIHLLDKRLIKAGFPPFPLDEEYIKFGIDVHNRTPAEFLNAIEFPDNEEYIKAFTNSMHCLPLFHPHTVVPYTVDLGRALVAFDANSYYNEGIESGGVYKYKYGTEKYKCEQMLDEARIQGAECVCRDSCSRTVVPYNNQLYTLVVYFTPQSPEYDRMMRKYANDPVTSSMIHDAAVMNLALLTKEHHISKDECKRRGIDPDFTENIGFSCQRDNSILWKKPFVEKLLMHRSRNGTFYAMQIAHKVLSGLQRRGYHEAFSYIHRKIQEVFLTDPLDSCELNYQEAREQNKGRIIPTAL